MGHAQYKTMQGFNDDSQVAFQSQPSLFQPQMVPMPRAHPMVGYSNQLVAGMQNLNIAGTGGCYWDGNSFGNPTNPGQQVSGSTNSGAQQMQAMQQNQTAQSINIFQQLSLDQNQQNMAAYQPMATQPQNFAPNTNSAFGRFQGSPGLNYDQNAQNTLNMQNQQPIGNTSINSQMVSTSMDDDNLNPAPMRLPLHMTKGHQRSNSMTPVDHNSGGTGLNNFLFDQLQPYPQLARPTLGKWSSENVIDKMNNYRFGPSTSLPAIRNTSDYNEAGASDSSVFDGNDSAVASSLDLSLDASGNPIFDNISASGDNNDGSSEVPVVKTKSKRQRVKKKSGFRKMDQNKNSNDSEYSVSDDEA